MTSKWTDRLSEYLDGELTPADRAEIEAELMRSPELRATLDELKQVVGCAQTLDDPPPASDLWPGIADRIRAGRRLDSEVVDLAARRRGWRRFSFSLPQLAAAAAALVVLSSGTVWLVHRGGPEPLVGVRGLGGLAAPGVTWFATFSDPAYDQAVAELELALQSGRGLLDTATVRVLEESLALIDQAIEDGRRALAADSASAYLNRHLAETMRRKIEFLRRANELGIAAQT